MAKQDANVYLEGDQIAAVDELVDGANSYTSRSDAVREAVDDFLEKHADDTGEA